MKHRILHLLLIVAAVLAAAIVSAEEIPAPVQNALDAGDTKLAIDLVRKNIAADPSYHVNYYVLGKIFYETEQYEKAEEQLKLALDKKSKSYESLYLLGLTQIAMEKLPEAKKTMQEGLKKDKKNKGIWENGLGLVLMEMEDYAAADAAFRKAIVEDEANPEYHINLGDANFRQGIPSLAIIEYEKALSVDTAGLEVYFHWAEACLETKDYNCAIEKLRVVLTKDSTYAPAWRRAGGIYFAAARSTRTRDERVERFKDVIGSYRKYLDLSKVQPDSSSVRVFFEMAMAYSELRGYEDAIGFFEQVLSIPMVPRDLYFYYGKALWGMQDYEKAADMLLKQIDWAAGQNSEYRATYRDYELYQLLGDSYYYRKPNEFSSAIRWYKKSLAERDDQTRLIENVAIAYHQLRSYRSALEYYQKRIEAGIDTTSCGIYKNAGYCALSIANQESSGESLEMLDELPGDEPEVVDTTDYFLLAVNYMSSYLTCSPNDAKVVELIANTYLFQLQDCTNGVAYFEQLLTLDPSSCAAKRALGFAYFGGVCNKNYSKALTYLLDAYKCISGADGACADVPLVLWIAQTYHLRAVEKGSEKTDYKNAHDWYSRVLKCDPSNPDALKGRDDTQFEF